MFTILLKIKVLKMVGETKFKVSMLLLRMSVILVMLMWTLDKFFKPVHAAKVYEKFYFIAGLENTVVYVIGGIEIIILIMFFLGIFKTFSYGAVLIFHSVSTFSAFAKYLAPFENLLFFTAWPMLAACLALFLLRKEDTLLQIGSK